MKRHLTLAAVIFVCSLFVLTGSAFAGGVVKLGFDSGGSLDTTNSISGASRTDDVNAAVSFALEGFGTIGKNVDLGGGIEIQSSRGLTDFPSRGKFQFVPIYMLVRLHPEQSDIMPFLTMQLGFSILNGNDAFTISSSNTTMPGGHFGIGVGYVLEKHFQLEVLSTLDTGNLQNSSGTVIRDYAYTKITFSIGYSF